MAQRHAITWEHWARTNLGVLRNVPASNATVPNVPVPNVRVPNALVSNVPMPNAPVPNAPVPIPGDAQGPNVL